MTILLFKQKSIPITGILTITLFFFQCTSTGEYPDILLNSLYPVRTIQETAISLPDSPSGVGKQITDRKFWEQMRSRREIEYILTEAETALTRGYPEITDALYLDFSKTGTRTNWEKAAWERKRQLLLFTIAECMENKGRFLPSLTSLITSLCTEKTWVMPAHDGNLDNFEQRNKDIDLNAASLAWDLATVRYILKPVLEVKTARLIEKEIYTRVLDPYKQMISGKMKKNWWIKGTNNWNAVCHAGVAGAALAIIHSKEERAGYILAVREYISFFLSGFSPGGYCSEGLGYWNYGFGHYLLLAETIYQATGGSVNLFTREDAREPAYFGSRVQIMNNIYPAFADCQVHQTPSALAMEQVKQRIDPNLPGWDKTVSLSSGLRLYEWMSAATLPPAIDSSPAGTLTHNNAQSLPPRTWFPGAGILISRPGENSDALLGVAMKGGNNDEHHNHNDVGSFVLAAGKDELLYDPGPEIYTAKTFGPDRYESNLLNSYGHSVPVTGGRLQRTGPDAKAVILEQDFTETVDTLTLDLTSAYAYTSLTSLTRGFVYSREGTGAFTITDKVQYRNKETFGTALLTPGIWRQVDKNTLIIFTLESAVMAAIDTNGIDFHITSEIIDEPSYAKIRPTRISIELAEPVKEATIRTTIIPAPVPQLKSRDNPVQNSGFEYSVLGWSLGNDTMAAITKERSYSGGYSLKINDQSGEKGTNIFSASLECTPDTPYNISGRYYPVSGKGLGIYIYFYNKNGERINILNKNGWVDPLSTLGGVDNRWTFFSFPFTTPAETANIKIWIHSYNKAIVAGFLDDIKISETEKAGIIEDLEDLIIPSTHTSNTTNPSYPGGNYRTI